MTAETILRSYRDFTPYYVEMLRERQHFAKQLHVIQELRANCHRSRARVLDVACGTGDVLSALAMGKDAVLAGSDGSPEMLSIALKNEALRGIPLARCEWLELYRLFSSAGQFDFIFLFGNAIAHVQSQPELARILGIVRDGLTPSGILAFDFRHWVYVDALKHLVEPGRKVGVQRPLGEFQIGGRRVRIADTCQYQDGRQVIRYRVSDLDVGSSASVERQEISFSYLPFGEQDALKLMRDSGFQSTQVLDRRPDYPYLIACGRRS